MLTTPNCGYCSLYSVLVWCTQRVEAISSVLQPFLIQNPCNAAWSCINLNALPICMHITAIYVCLSLFVISAFRSFKCFPFFQARSFYCSLLFLPEPFGSSVSPLYSMCTFKSTACWNSDSTAAKTKIWKGPLVLTDHKDTQKSFIILLSPQNTEPTAVLTALKCCTVLTNLLKLSFSIKVWCKVQLRLLYFYTCGQ